MPLNNQVPAHDTLYMGEVQTICEKITAAKENLIVDVLNGKLPAKAHVIGGGIHVTVAFADTGTDTLDVGFRGGNTTDDPDAYATLLDISSLGYKPFDELAAVTNIMQTQDATLTWRYNGANNDAAGVGEGYLIFTYVLNRE